MPSPIFVLYIAIDKFADKPGEAPDMAAVSLSAFLTNIVDPIWIECRQFESYYEKLLPVNRPTIVGLLSQIDQEFSEYAPLMKITTPVKSLVECYNEATVAAL